MIESKVTLLSMFFWTLNSDLTVECFTTLKRVSDSSKVTPLYSFLNTDPRWQQISRRIGHWWIYVIVIIMGPTAIDVINNQDRMQHVHKSYWTGIKKMHRRALNITQLRTFRCTQMSVWECADLAVEH